MNLFKKIVTIVLSVVLWLVILLAGLFAFTTLATRDDNNVANLAGFTPLSVQTDSMAPTFNSGDLIIIHTVDPSTLKVGDIVTFHTIIQNQYVLNTHRIASIDTEGGVNSYTTKGDNNLIEDSHVIADGDIVGKYVTRLPKVGLVMDFLSTSAGFLIVVVLPLLIFFIYQLYHLIMVVINLKKAEAIEAAVAAQEAAAAVAAKAAPAPAAAGDAAPSAVDDELAKAREEAARARAEAEAALEEARRLKAEAEALKNSTKQDS